MKMNEPIGNPLYGPLILRLTLGAYFVLKGLYVLDNMPSFVRLVQSFGVLPEPFATLYAILIPYLSLIAGTFLVLGIWTTLGSIIAALMLLSFVVALGIFPSNREIFNKDLILLAGTLSLLYSGAGAWSIDRFRKTG